VAVRITRRGFLGGLLAAPWLSSPFAGAAEPQQAKKQPAAPILDVHIHLFGTGDAKSGCRLSRKVTEGVFFKSQVGKFRRKAKTLDEGYVVVLAETLEASGLDKGVILAQDAVYDRNGLPDWEKTHFYVPNDYLFAVVRRYAQRMIPCISINPDRADAVPELERWAEQGARVLKIHPPTQGVDIADKKHARFFRRCAELKVVVMVHTGHEHSAPVVNIELASPKKLELALGEGCTVVACHCGSGWPTDHPDMLPDFLAMLRQYKNLWGDTAVLGTPGRVRDLLRLLADDVAKDRLLHGSDYPFPAFPLGFLTRLGPVEAARLQAIKNPLKQDLALKEALGIGRTSAARAYRLVHG